jgi:hypothetical protein
MKYIIEVDKGNYHSFQVWASYTGEKDLCLCSTDDVDEFIKWLAENKNNVDDFVSIINEASFESE